MKKVNLKSLEIHKESISNLLADEIKGGTSPSGYCSSSQGNDYMCWQACDVSVCDCEG